MGRKPAIEVLPEEIDESQANGAQPAEEAKVAEVEEVDSSEAVTVKVLKNNRSGPKEGYTRVFSKAKHGKTFKKDAQAFADRFGGEII